MKAPLQPRRPRRGFSLPEMLVVIVIIIFATTVSLLAYRNYRQGSALRMSSEKVRSGLVQARSRSIAAGLPSSFVVDIDNNTFWIDDLNSDYTVKSPKIIPLEYLPQDAVIEEVTINSTTFSDGIRGILFQSDGTNPFLTIVLRRTNADITQDKNYYSIQMYPSSSTPKVWPNERK